MDASKLKKAKTGREATYSTKDILDVMGDKEWKRSSLFDEVNKFKDKNKMSEATFDNLRRAAETTGLIAKSNITGLWSVVQ